VNTLDIAVKLNQRMGGNIKGASIRLLLLYEMQYMIIYEKEYLMVLFYAIYKCTTLPLYLWHNKDLQYYSRRYFKADCVAF